MSNKLRSAADLPPELVGAYSTWKKSDGSGEDSNRHTYMVEEVDQGGRVRIFAQLQPEYLDSLSPEDRAEIEARIPDIKRRVIARSISRAAFIDRFESVAEDGEPEDEPDPDSGNPDPGVTPGGGGPPGGPIVPGGGGGTPPAPQQVPTDPDDKSPDIKPRKGKLHAFGLSLRNKILRTVLASQLVIASSVFGGGKLSHENDETAHMTDAITIEMVDDETPTPEQPLPFVYVDDITPVQTEVAATEPTSTAVPTEAAPTETPEPTVEPTATVAPTETPDPTQELIASTPEASPSTPEPVVSPEATSEPTLEPTPEPTSDPAARTDTASQKEGVQGGDSEANESELIIYPSGDAVDRSQPQQDTQDAYDIHDIDKNGVVDQTDMDILRGGDMYDSNSQGQSTEVQDPSIEIPQDFTVEHNGSLTGLLMNQFGLNKAEAYALYEELELLGIENIIEGVGLYKMPDGDLGIENPAEEVNWTEDAITIILSWLKKARG